MFDLLQLAGGLILAIGYIPQITQLIRTKSSVDLNLKSYALVCVGIAFIEVYAADLALNGTGLMFLITNTMSLALMICICVLITITRFKYIKQADRPKGERK